MKRIQIRKLSKKRLILIGILIVGLVVAGSFAGFFLRMRAGYGKEQAMTVQSAQAETGNINTTVTGTGTLESGAETDVVVPAGITVKEVLVESGEQVEKGQKLATVDKASVAAELLEVRETLEETEDEIDALSDEADEEGTDAYLEAQVLYGRQEELKEAGEALEELLDTQVIKAGSAGIISGIYVSEDAETEQSSTTDSASGDSSAGSGTSSGVTPVSTRAGESGILLLTADVSGTADTLSDMASTTIENCSIALAAPVAGAKPQSSLADSESYTGKVTWNCTTEVFQANTVYTATVTLTAKDGYEFAENIHPEVDGGDVYGETVETDSGNSVLRFKVKFAKTGAASSGNADDGDNKASGSDADSGKTSGSTSGSQTKQSGSGSSGSGSASGNSGTGGSTGASGGTASGSVSASGSTSSDGQTTSEYSVYESVAFSIASETETIVSINVDELDILSVQEGQTAVVTLDALEDQEFEGTITKIASSSSESGSSVKYPVEITLEKTEDMLLGMSASATIQIDTAQNAVLIPVSALQERGDSTFVYTEQDEDGTLSGEVEVETGLSDGSRVEITSGLSKGDTVYYMESGESDSDAQSGMPQDAGGFSGGDMEGSPFGVGEMPSGGGGPSGGPGGAE